MDEFKSVNDTFGHGVGDAVLAEVGSTIYAVFSKVGYACFNPVLGSVEGAIKRADRMMYHYKRKLKETSAAK